MRPRVLVGHVHIAFHLCRAEPDFGVGELEAAFGARQRDVKRLTGERVDDRPAFTFKHPRDFHARRSAFEIGLQVNRQEQGFADFRAGGSEDGEHIAHRLAGFARDDGFQRGPLVLVRALVDDDLALAVAVLDFARPLVKRRPVEPFERRVVETALDDVADEGGLAKTVGGGQVELAAAVNGAVAVIVSFAFEQPLIGHVRALPCGSLGR